MATRMLMRCKQAKPYFLRYINRYKTATRSLSSQATQMDISGVYPPIATPFNKDESIAYDKLTYNLEKWDKIPFRGYVVQGSNGEYAFQTPEERVEIVQHVVKHSGDKKLIIAGSGCESTTETIKMSKKMADVGAKAVLVVTPCYYKGSMTTAALINHYTKVADDCPVPVILYSVPSNTGIDLGADVIIPLSEHPNIIGLKDSGGDISKLGDLVYRTEKNNFQVLAGSAGFLLSSYLVGCVGGICGLGNLLGQEICDLESLFKQGQMEEAKKLQHRLIAVNACVTRRFGVPGMKTAMEWFGYYGGPTRSPLQPLPSQDLETMRQIFKHNGFLQ